MKQPSVYQGNELWSGLWGKVHWLVLKKQGPSSGSGPDSWCGTGPITSRPTYPPDVQHCIFQNILPFISTGKKWRAGKHAWNKWLLIVLLIIYHEKVQKFSIFPEVFAPPPPEILTHYDPDPGKKQRPSEQTENNTNPQGQIVEVEEK